MTSYDNVNICWSAAKESYKHSSAPFSIVPMAFECISRLNWIGANLSLLSNLVTSFVCLFICFCFLFFFSGFVTSLLIYLRLGCCVSNFCPEWSQADCCSWVETIERPQACFPQNIPQPPSPNILVIIPLPSFLHSNYKPSSCHRLFGLISLWTDQNAAAILVARQLLQPGFSQTTVNDKIVVLLENPK